MKKILEFIKIGFKQRIIYRTSTLWALISSFLVLFLQIKLWQVLIASSAVRDSRTLLDMVAFLVINLFLASLTTCNAVGMIESLIGDGSVSSNLTVLSHSKSKLSVSKSGQTCIFCCSQRCCLLRWQLPSMA